MHGLMTSMCVHVVCQVPRDEIQIGHSQKQTKSEIQTTLAKIPNLPRNSQLYNAQRTPAGRRMARRHRAGRPGSLAGTGSGERRSRGGRGEALRARSVRSLPPPQPPTHMRGAWLKATPLPPVRRSIASCCRGEVRLQRCPVHPACKLQAYRLLLGGSRSGGSVGGIALPVVHLRGQRGALRRAEARASVGSQQWQAQCRRRLSPAPREEAGPEQALSRP